MIAIISKIVKAETRYYHQDIINFNGKKLCSFDMLPNQSYEGWPSKTSGLYYDYKNRSLLKTKSLCASPDQAFDFINYSTTFTKN